MEPYEYRTLFEFESFYWWYRGLHTILLDTFKKLGIRMNSLVLDAGCGTGQNLVNIMSKITHHAFGFDISHHTSPFWSQRGLKQVFLASINDIPFPNDTFDAAISIDVLECHEVCEGRAYSELWRVVKMGGFVILVVPAYKWLFSKSHDRAVHASRRYSERMVLSLLRTRPVEIIRLTHLFASLLPAVAGYRLAQRCFGSNSDSQPRSDLRPLPSILNGILSLVVDLERRVLKQMDLPFGSSILAVARKVSG